MVLATHTFTCLATTLLRETVVGALRYRRFLLELSPLSREWECPQLASGGDIGHALMAQPKPAAEIHGVGMVPFLFALRRV